MTELEVPVTILMRVSRASYQNEKMRFGTLREHENYTFLCFLPEIQEWIATNFKAKSRRAVKIHLEHRDQLPYSIWIVSFRNPEDAALFKMWWL